jgi:hypothetical protein
MITDVLVIRPASNFLEVRAQILADLSGHGKPVMARLVVKPLQCRLVWLRKTFDVC